MTGPQRRRDDRGPEPDQAFAYKVSDAARYLGLGANTVRTYTKVGVLQCVWTPGGQRRFSRAQLDAFIAKAAGER